MTKFRPLQIAPKNASKIAAALSAVNGRAVAHCFATFDIVSLLAERAEAEVVTLVGAKAHAGGASVTCTSGHQVSNAYARKAWTRVATRLRMERRASGWWLVSIEPTKVWAGGGGPALVRLTAGQAARAHAALAARFIVAAAPAHPDDALLTELASPIGTWAVRSTEGNGFWREERAPGGCWTDLERASRYPTGNAARAAAESPRGPVAPWEVVDGSVA